MITSLTKSPKRRRLILTAFTALCAGLVLSWLFRPLVLRELAFHRLFSQDVFRRAEAASFLLHHEQYADKDSTATVDSTRLAEDDQLAQRIITRLTSLIISNSRQNNMIFDDIVPVLNESAWWKPEYIPPTLWGYRLNRLLDNPSSDSAHLALRQLVIWESQTLDQQHHRNFDRVWIRLINRADDPDLCYDTFVSSLKYLTTTDLNRIGILPEVLNESDPRLRRAAWITIGLVNSETGYSADWLAEPESAVVEAMLWAAVKTNPDQPQPLIRAVEMTPWKTTILPWLLALSPGDESLRILRGLHTDGNPAALIPLLERLKENAPAPASPAIAAFHGLNVPENNDNSVFERWYLWRTVTPHTWSLRQFNNWIKTPAAEDGSVWAAVLLAERFLTPQQAGHISRTWLSSMDDGDRRAGVLLAALLDLPDQDITAILQSSSASSVVRRYAAISHMIINYRNDNPHAPGNTLPSEILYARRIISPALVGWDLDILTALLAVHDDWAVLQILGNANLTASDRLLRFQWLIERFLPRQYQKVAPLDPWNESVARLQCDIMTIDYYLQDDNPTSLPDQ